MTPTLTSKRNSTSTKGKVMAYYKSGEILREASAGSLCRCCHQKASSCRCRILQEHRPVGCAEVGRGHRSPSSCGRSLLEPSPTRPRQPAGAASLVATDPRAAHQPLAEMSYVNPPAIAPCTPDSPLRCVDTAIPHDSTGAHTAGPRRWMLAWGVLHTCGTVSREPHRRPRLISPEKAVITEEFQGEWLPGSRMYRFSA